MKRRHHHAAIKIVNHTDYPTRFLRRMLKWCLRRMDVGQLPRAVFEPAKRAFGGRYQTEWRRVIVRIGKAEAFPISGRYPGLKTAPVYTLADRIEGLVHVTLHECWHRRQHENGSRFSEIETERRTRSALDDFRRDRDTLLAQWGPMERTLVPTPEIWPGIIKSLESMESVPLDVGKESNGVASLATQAETSDDKGTQT